jgi:hypothetical protein
MNHFHAGKRKLLAGPGQPSLAPEKYIPQVMEFMILGTSIRL